MIDKHYFSKALFATMMALIFSAATAIAQCTIPIAPGQSYIEDFQSGEMECWTVETTSSATWEVMQGTGSNVVAFQNASAGQEARLVSPTFDLTGSNSATFSFAYAMMALYDNDELIVSYRTSPSDSWHQLATYSINDWANTYDASFALEDLSSTFQVSFMGHCNGGYYIFIDDIEIASAGGCARPVNLNASEITTTSALLEWSTVGNEESWTIDLNGHIRTVDVQPYREEGLDPQTDYSFRVKANCGGGMESEWSQPMTFKTLCEVIVVTDDVPYFDDFESSEEFVCWQNEIGSGTDGWVVDPGYLILNNTAFFYWDGGDALLYSAPLDITAVTSPALTFKHKQQEWEYNVDELSVWYRTAETEPWLELGHLYEPTNGWDSVTYFLPDPSATYQIGFLGIGHNAEGIYVDDVWVGNLQGVGVNENAAPIAMAHPNPTQGNITVMANITEGEVMVYDLFGRLVKTGLMREGRAELDLSGIAKGVYMARITSVMGTVTIKLTKE